MNNICSQGGIASAKSRGGEENPISVAKAEASTNQSGKLFCKFCKCAGHDLLTCNNTEKVLKGHKEACHQEFLAKQNPETSKSNKPNQSGKSGKKPALAQANQATVAGSTLAVAVGNFSDDSNNSSKFEVLGAATVVSLLSRISTDNTNVNLDLGCLVLMTPFICSVDNISVDITAICFADSSTVNATHVGRALIPLGVNTLVKTLIVPELHEPLLSVAALCNKGLLVFFGATSCRIFSSSNLSVTGIEVGAGYRRGNLFYLPLVADVSFPFSSASAIPDSFSSALSATVPNFDHTLLDYHSLLLHIGVKPLKTILQQNHI